MLTEEEWEKQEGQMKKLLYTREEWLSRSNRNNTEASQNQRYRGRDKSKVRCFSCNTLGHYAAECRKPRRGKEQRQEVNISQIDDDEPALLMAKLDDRTGDLMLVNESKVVPSKFPGNGGNKTESNVWYLDNDASNHMTGCKSKFTKLNERITGAVKFGDGSKVSIEGKGSITFKCKNGQERTIHEVYYIPSLCNNILSLGQLSEEGNKIMMKGEHLWVYDTSDDLLIKVKRSSNRLYKLIIESSKPMCLMSKVETKSKLWHARLGHVNYQAMHLMSSKQMVRGMPKVTQPKEKCVGCLMSKQARKPFPSKAEYSATKILELIHCDICGPISPETTAGNKYFLLLVDDYSRVMWAYLLRSKDEALSTFKKF